MKRLEVGRTGGFSGMVARYCDVDDAARGDVARKEDGGEFDLARKAKSISGCSQLI